MSEVWWHRHSVTRDDRFARFGHVGATIWLTGLSGSGKSTIANSASSLLFEVGISSYVLDGDNLRHGLNSDLGFADFERVENVRRVGEVAQILADAGLVVFVPIISPFASGRASVRSRHQDLNLAFAEVFVATPLLECERRDPKGLYARQREGKVSGLSGVDAPYEPPTSADLVMGTVDRTADDCASELVTSLAHLWLPPAQ